ncbi:TetR/AcrR family transcriptional regulator [uncultured Ruminococcus sp.]|jgi:AcrR family transcriptional regulator|uniref:TetR/AcrR family transcriptional regulator n=1 Tax=uncultured Ruminococcus sp. TaxID=165186 RepID=UPI0025D421F1|nr:TetR family transcriptional regulator [uncultured Ruminococcus sp.]
MIKKTFYNLPYEKRKRITDAVIKEFMERPNEKVSINRIIKTAEISRGSFYQYFDDKVDLIEIITKTMFEESSNKAKEILKLSCGDLFVMYIKMFDYFGDYSSQKQTMKIMRNIVDSFKANDDLVSEYLKNRFNIALSNNEIYLMVDRQNLKFQDNESVKCLIEILTQVLKNAIFDVFVAGSDREEVRERLIKKIDIIKQGAVK